MNDLDPASYAIKPMTDTELENYKLHRRFDRMGRLIGDLAMEKLLKSHVMVLGLGGVGSWSAESLVRSGVGTVTVVDFDKICVTNFNRQVHSLQGLVGADKATVMAERLKMINPQAVIRPIVKFYNADNADGVFSLRPDYVIDAIDNVTAKCHLLGYCKEKSIPIVTITGSGGRMDPTQIAVKDLAKTEVDPLARAVRRILREKYAFPEKGEFGIPAIYSKEAASGPQDLTYDKGLGFRCVCPQGNNEFFNCDNRNLIMGNASFVTGAFGFVAASHVVKALISS